MRMGPARAVLAERVTDRIRECFAAACDRDQLPAAAGVAVSTAPALARGSGSVCSAHDPSRVPSVPAATVEIDRSARHAGTMVLTYKVEQGYPPHAQLRVPANWPATVAHRGHVVLAGYPVLAVLDRDSAARPARARVAVIDGMFDPMMHGWRAWARTATAELDWDDGDSQRPEGAPACWLRSLLD